MVLPGQSDRRSFLKASVLGTAGLSLGAAFNRRVRAAWTEGTQINPAVPNDRVVCCHDNAMNPSWSGQCNDGQNLDCVGRGHEVNSNFPRTMDHSFTEQNSLLDSARMQADLDAMARSLTKVEDPVQAWGTLFMKPAGTSWDQVRVAVKVDANGLVLPHIPIVDKVCRELHRLGVPYKNIVLFDGEAYTFDPDAGKVVSSVVYYYGPYLGNGLPEDVVVSNYYDALGGTVMADIPAPMEGAYPCAADIANGKVDILINLACSKPHGTVFGGATLCLKNHVGGTFLRQFPDNPFHGYDWCLYMLAVNKSNAVLGGSPARQQLCIVDAVWSAHCCGPLGFGDVVGGQDRQPNRLIMGTFAPLVDVVTIKILKSGHHKDYMQYDKERPLIVRFLTEFGYPESMLSMDHTEVSSS